MLYYLLFWTLLGFIIHLYIIFGTNLLTGGPAQNCCFFPIAEFRRKRISNGVQTEWNLREHDFRNEQDPGDLDPTSRHKRGGHEVGGRPRGGGHAPHPRGHPYLPWRALQVPWVAFLPKITSPVDFILFWLRLIFHTEIGIKQQIWARPPVNRLVPKVI